MSIRICLIVLVFAVLAALSDPAALATTSGGSDSGPVSKEQIDQLMMVVKQRLELRDELSTAVEVRDGDEHVQDGLRTQTGYRSAADVLDRQDGWSEGCNKLFGGLLEKERPAAVIRHDDHLSRLQPKRFCSGHRAHFFAPPNRLAILLRTNLPTEPGGCTYLPTDEADLRNRY